MAYVRKKAVIDKECVACGSCIKHCPKGAITIHKGIKAIVDELKCVGCGKCVKICPAGVINLTIKESINEKALV